MSAESCVAAAPCPARGFSLIDAKRALHACALSVGAWRHAKGGGPADRFLLANMSERELNDIGLTRAAVESVADYRWAPRDVYWN